MTVAALRDLVKRLVGGNSARLETKEALLAAVEAARAVQPGARAGTGKAAKGVGKPGMKSQGAAKKAPVRKSVAKQAGGKKPAATKAPPKTAVATKAPPKKAVATKAPPGKGAAPQGTAARKNAAATKAPAGKGPATLKSARKAGAAKGATHKGVARRSGPPPEAIDPEGYFIARVRGEDAVRQAPHPMTEDEDDDAMRLHGLADVPVPRDDEGLGDLPWRYGDDVFVALPRDPRTLFFYWDYAEGTVARAFEWLDHPRAQMWVFAQVEGGAWERLREVEFALESRGFYVHDLEPGRIYRGEVHVVDRAGKERRIAEPSNPVALPPSGPSPFLDDLFATIPWDVPLERWMRELRAGGQFSDDLRELLARLSDWSRFRQKEGTGGTSGRPSSPEGGWGAGSGSGSGKGSGAGKGDA